MVPLRVFYSAYFGESFSGFFRARGGALGFLFGVIIGHWGLLLGPGVPAAAKELGLLQGGEPKGQR